MVKMRSLFTAGSRLGLLDVTGRKKLSQLGYVVKIQLIARAKRDGSVIDLLIHVLPCRPANNRDTRTYLGIRGRISIRGGLDTYLDIRILHGYFGKTNEIM